MTDTAQRYVIQQHVRAPEMDGLFQYSVSWDWVDAGLATFDIEADAQQVVDELTKKVNQAVKDWNEEISAYHAHVNAATDLFKACTKRAGISKWSLSISVIGWEIPAVVSPDAYRAVPVTYPI